MNRVVLVTGACGGIGRGLCRRFVEQDDTVLALDIDATALAALRDELGASHVTPVAVDIGDAVAVRDAVAQAAQQRGPVDVLVANAGAAEGLTLATTDAASWQRFVRKLLVGLQGQTGKVALGCRNMHCVFDGLDVTGRAKPRPGRDAEAKAGP